MRDTIDSFVTSVESLEKTIADAFPDDNSLAHHNGDLAPDLDKDDLVELVGGLKNTVATIDPKKWDSDIEGYFEYFEEKIEHIKEKAVPNLFNGNAGQACASLKFTMDWIAFKISPYQKQLVDWDEVEGSSTIPKSLAAKLRAISTRITNLGEKAEGLDEKVDLISSAHKAAEALPTDLEELKDATKAINASKAAVDRDEASAASGRKEVTDAVERIRGLQVEASELVESVEDAYSAATTLGLGEAFSKRAKNLAITILVWVIGLAVALGLAAWQGYSKIEVLQSLIAEDKSPSIIWATLITAFLSVAAPVWFAWMATKQIGQRFRLAEDYAYKASVAKAYEGYRREATRLDPDFANRLFRIALDRLEEAPLRFVEDENHGSPWAEALASRFKKKEPNKKDTDATAQKGEKSVEAETSEAKADVTLDPEDLE